MRRSFLAIGLISLATFVAAEVPQATDDSVLAKAAANTSTMHRVTEKPFLMDAAAAQLCDRPKSRKRDTPHRDYYCHVFVNESALPAMKSGKVPYPVGAIIVKQKFSDPEEIKEELYTLMRKMPKGYDPEHGDWEYSIISGNADKVLSRGRTDSCIECHQQHAKSDYVTRLYLKDQPTGRDQ